MAGSESNKSTRKAAVRGPGGLTFGMAAALFVFFLSVYALTMQGVSTGGDSWGMYLVTQGIADRGSVLLAPSDSVVLAPCADGVHFCSRFGIGQSLAQIPLYYAGKALLRFNPFPDADTFLYFATSFTNPLLTAATCLLLLLFLLRLGNPLRRSIFLCMLFGLGTLAWPYSKALLSEALQTLCVTACAYLIYAFSHDGRLLRIAAAGFFFGLLIATKGFLAVLFPVVAVYVVAKARAGGGRREAVRALACFIPPVAAWGAVALAYNHARFGGAFNFGYYLLNDRDSLYRFSVPLYVGLHGLLISSGKGLFFYVPATAAACASFRAFHARHRHEALLCAAMVITLAVAYAKWNQWHGDFAWGPRFLVPAMPFIVLPLGAGLGAFLKKRPFTRYAAVGALLALSVFVQVLGVSVKTGAYLTMARSQPPFQILYRPGDILLRDDLLNQHFIPEFSPLAAHWWMLKHTLLDSNRSPERQRRLMDSDLPWKTLLPRGAPQNPLWCLGFDTWGAWFREYFPESRPKIALLLFTNILGIAAAACAILIGVRKM